MHKVAGIGGFFFAPAIRRRWRRGIAIILAWSRCRIITTTLRGNSRLGRRRLRRFRTIRNILALPGSSG